MELDQTDSFRAGETSRQLPRDEGLARPGRPLKDDLTLVVEQLLDRPQVGDVEEQRVGARPPALLGAGDYLRFVPLESEDSYQQILGRVERGEYRVVTEEAK